MAEEVRPDLQLEPVCGPPLRHCHHARVVDQHVDLAGRAGERPDRPEVGEVERPHRYVAGHRRCDRLALGRVAAGEDDVRTVRGEFARRGLAQPAVRAGHHERATGLIGQFRGRPGHAPKRTGSAQPVAVMVTHDATDARCCSRTSSEGSQRRAGRPTSSAPLPSGATASSVPSRSQSGGAHCGSAASSRAGTGGHHGTGRRLDLRCGPTGGGDACAPGARLVENQRPARPEHPRHAVGEQRHRLVRVLGEPLEQFQLAVRVDLPGVGPDRFDLDALDGGGRGDQRVGELVRRQFDDEVVDGVARTALDHVQAENVRAGVAQRARHGAEGAGAVRQDDPQQVGHLGQGALRVCRRRYAGVRPSPESAAEAALDSGVVSEAEPARISRDDVAHLARLARLAVTDDELDLFAGQLDVILGAVARVGEVAAQDIPPTTHAVPIENVFRPDEVTPCLPRDAVLAGAPSVEDDKFRVPRILSEEA